MTMNRVLVNLYVPLMEKKYNIWIPVNRSINCIIKGFISGINSLNQIQYNVKTNYPRLYNKVRAAIYEYNAKVIDTDIRNGTELILF